MKIAIIANNFGKTYDGIGAYAAVEAKYFKEKAAIVVYTANCSEADSKFSRIINRGMTEQIKKCMEDIPREKFDAVILEYPFVEWNPSIVGAVNSLKRELTKSGVTLVLSLHEYLRVNKIRQFVIRKLCSCADLVMVSNEENQKAVSAFTSHLAIRDIPSNIYDDTAFSKEIMADPNSFAFFGLVNPTKAFVEMLEAWDAFNSDGSKRLFIMTSTILDQDIEQKHPGLKYIKNANDEQIIRTLRSSRFAVIPVRPEVGRNNATFKTCSMCGCICVGKYCNEFSDLPFVINIKSYAASDILDGLNRTRKLSEVSVKSNDAVKFGMQFSPERIASGVLKEIVEYRAHGRV